MHTSGRPQGPSKQDYGARYPMLDQFPFQPRTNTWAGGLPGRTADAMNDILNKTIVLMLNRHSQHDKNCNRNNALN